MIFLNDNHKEIYKTIDRLIEQRMSELEFNYTQEGKIIGILQNNNYLVKINNEDYTIKSINNNEYLINDVVYVLVINNTSRRMILCKRP